jgi:hypothetical protein
MVTLVIVALLVASANGCGFTTHDFIAHRAR